MTIFWLSCTSLFSHSKWTASCHYWATECWLNLPLWQGVSVSPGIMAVETRSPSQQ